MARASDKPRPEREASLRAGLALSFVLHALVFVLGCALLWVVAGPLATRIVALSWGILFATHGFFAVLVPLLRPPLERRALARVEPSVAPPALAASRPLEELSAAIAHELRSPLTAARSLVQQIAEDPSAPECGEFAAVALGELDRAERSIAHLLRFARAESLELAEMSLAHAVLAAVESCRERALSRGATLDAQVQDPGPSRGDEEKLQRAVFNLVANALDALEEAGTAEPRVVVSAGQSLAGDALWVSVRDNGPGIPSDTLPRLFAPFFTTKKGGTGLGLALSRKTALAHGGDLEARNTKGGGAEFILTVAREPRAAMRAGGTS